MTDSNRIKRFDCRLDKWSSLCLRKRYNFRNAFPMWMVWVRAENSIHSMAIGSWCVRCSLANMQKQTFQLIITIIIIWHSRLFLNAVQFGFLTNFYCRLPHLHTTEIAIGKIEPVKCIRHSIFVNVWSPRIWEKTETTKKNGKNSIWSHMHRDERLF